MCSLAFSLGYSFLSSALYFTKSLQFQPFSSLVLLDLEGDLCCGGCGGDRVLRGYSCSREECFGGLKGHVEGRAQDCEGHWCEEL